MRECTECKKSLSHDCFYALKSNRLKRTCKQCERDKAKEHYKRNKEVKRLKSREYYNSLTIEEKRQKEKQKKRKPVNIEERREKGRIYYSENNEKVLERKRKWKENNREAFKEIVRRRTQKRRAKKLNLDNNYSALQWEECKKVFDSKCAYCGAECNLTQDHFIAVDNNGEYTRNNIIPSCKSCNSSKNNKDFFEWYKKHASYSAKREQAILAYLNYNNNIQQLSIL